MKSLTDAIQILTEAVRTNFPEFETAQYVEIRQNEHEIVLGGNREGLVWLALHCLNLSQQTKGSHIHLDEVSGTNACDIPLIIRHWTQEPNQQ
jgi:hypothetical protein